jgi:hypothetical protein
MERLYDDHQVNSSTQGQMHAMAQTEGPASSQEGGMHTLDGQQGQQNQPSQSDGGLDTTSSTDEANPVRAAVAASNYSHDDIMVVLSGLSLIAWVAMLYMMKQKE